MAERPIKAGDKVVFAYLENGYLRDIELAGKLLSEGSTYIVEKVIVESFFTTIYFNEFQGIGFNSVNFEIAP